jgi:hypothetical protein
MDTNKQKLESILASLDFVMWDRYAGSLDSEIHIYGWIARNDSYKDFVVLTYKDTQVESFITSSEKYTEQIAKILGFENHGKCIRAENDFDISNLIKLNKNNS